ncbi:hypothetical protein V8E54_008934 [Elaphomyces granulatus]
MHREPLHPRDNEPPQYAQLFLDPSLQPDSRHGQNPTLNSHLLRKLDDLIREKQSLLPCLSHCKGEAGGYFELGHPDYS